MKLSLADEYGLRLLRRRYTEAGKRQDHGPDGHIRLGSFRNMPAPGTTDYTRADVPLGSDAMQHRVGFAAQLDQPAKR